MFPAEAKEKAKMIHNIILAYQNRIKFDLMSAETKVKAIEKIE
jgi:predicted metalloendopeptidase